MESRATDCEKHTRAERAEQQSEACTAATGKGETKHTSKGSGNKQTRSKLQAGQTRVKGWSSEEERRTVDVKHGLVAVDVLRLSQTQTKNTEKRTDIERRLYKDA